MRCNAFRSHGLLAGIAVALVLIGAYLWLNAGFFRGVLIEYGDFANNALRIRNAKALHEIYGNYSRWGFHHPGPAFFYLYALGEALAFDLMRVVGSPMGAHTLIGLLFQVACSIAAAAYALRKVELLAALPLAAAGLVVHWHYMSGAPLSIWPPHVLFGPLLLLLVFGAGLTSGDAWALPVVVFAGAMLVHGHVAQPLMVLPIFALTAGAWLVKTRGAIPWKPVAASAAIVLPFLLPLAIDALPGADSNLAAILRHVRRPHGEQHTIGQGLGYALSFVRYEMYQETRQGAPEFSFAAYARDFGWWWLAAPLPLAAAIAALRSSMGYLRCYAAVLLLAALLSTAWSVLQDGPMYDFNANFIFAVTFAGYLLAALLLCRVVAPRVGQRARWALAAVGVAALLYGLAAFPKGPFPYNIASPEFVAAVQRLAQTTRCANVPFDETSADEASAAVNQMDRAGMAVGLPPRWSGLYPYGRGPPDAAACTPFMVGREDRPGNIPIPPIAEHGPFFLMRANEAR